MPNSESSGSARRPAPRFNEDEKTILVGLVEKRKHILECKKTDVASLNKKTETWEELCKQYNSNHGVTPRDPKQLKKFWGNMKQKWKEERSEEKRKVIKTGGGPPPPPMGTVSALVGAVAGLMATRIANTDDSDGASYLAPVDSEPVLRLLRPMVTGEEDLLYDSFEDDYQPRSPTYEQDIQRDKDGQVNKQAATPPRSSTATAYCSITPSVLPANESTEKEDPVPPETESTPVVPRGRLALLQRTLGEEADLRFALLREEHSLRLRLLQEDHNDMLKKRDDEHKRKMAILQKQKEIEDFKLKSLQQAGNK